MLPCPYFTFSMLARNGLVLRRWYRLEKMCCRMRYAAFSVAKKCWKGQTWELGSPESLVLSGTWLSVQEANKGKRVCNRLSAVLAERATAAARLPAYH